MSGNVDAWNLNDQLQAIKTLKEIRKWNDDHPDYIAMLEKVTDVHQEMMSRRIDLVGG